MAEQNEWMNQMCTSNKCIQTQHDVHLWVFEFDTLMFGCNRGKNYFFSQAIVFQYLWNREFNCSSALVSIDQADEICFWKKFTELGMYWMRQTPNWERYPMNEKMSFMPMLFIDTGDQTYLLCFIFGVPRNCSRSSQCDMANLHFVRCGRNNCGWSVNVYEQQKRTDEQAAREYKRRKMKKTAPFAFRL